MKRLYELDPNEVSLVPRGANKKKFLIFKSLKGKKMPTEIQNLINSVDEKTMAKIEKVLKGKVKKTMGKESPGNKAKLGKAGVGSDMAPKPGSAAMSKDAGADHQVTDEGVSHDHKPLSDRAQAALKATARILAPFKDEISDDHLDAIQQEIGIHTPEMMDEATPSDEKVEMSMAIPEGVEEEHHSAALDMAKKSYMEHMEKMGYRQAADPSLDETNAVGKDAESEEEEEEEDVSKVQKTAGSLDLSAFPVGQRAQLEAVFKSHNALVAENKELVEKTGNLEKQLKEERDHRVLKGFEEKAKGFKHLGANSSELAVVMKSLAESDPKSYEKIESIFKAADEQIRVGASLYKEIGSRQGSGNQMEGAEGKLEALVDSVVAKSDGKTREQVYEQVLKTTEGKRLYAEFKASRPHGI